MTAVSMLRCVSPPPTEPGSYQQVTVRGGADLRLGSRINALRELPFNEKRASRLTGSLPLVQNRFVGAVMFFLSISVFGFSVWVVKGFKA